MKIDVEPFANYPLSSQQCAVHVDDWQTNAPVHAILIEGSAPAVQVDVLRAALGRVVERHEILRTCYRSVTGLRYPVQHVRPVLAPAWKLLDPAVDDEALIAAGGRVGSGPDVAAPRWCSWGSPEPSRPP